MHKKRLRTLALSLALLSVAASASAIGFQASTPAAVLGQTLNHVIGLRLDAGESLAPECVTAQVQSGDLRLPAGAVSARLEGEGRSLVLRVQTSVVIDEPVLELTVSLGCPAQLSRRFVLFADPAPIADAQPAMVPVVVDPAPALAVADSQTAPASSRPPAAPPSPAATLAERRAPATSASAATPPTPRPRPQRRAQSAARSPPAAGGAAPGARPRLRLDAVEPEPSPPRPMAEIIEAAASAAAALAAEQAASAAAARIAALEQSIERLRADSAADRQALLALRQRAAANDAAAAWLPYLLGLTAVLLLLAAWLALKLRQLQRERQQAWWNAAAVAETVRSQQPDPAVPDTLARPLAAAGAATISGYTSTRPGPPGPLFKPDPVPEPEPLTEPPATLGERTQALPVGWREDAEPQRDVSIEELIDLEQQAEFFIVLGQEDAAIDLLVDHLRSTGGGSPMPYLKLLEIYRRRGDHEAYERTRARFNHRFNAYAPDWESEGHDGRSLEDYPSIVARLQMAWPSPIDAMAELESLLFRKTRGELFDMPAYRDVLFLYSLARDLLDREPLEAGNVDVLLPINDGADHTQPMSLESSPDTVDSDLVSLDNQPTVPIDLDVTQPVMPESLFGNPSGPARGSRRRR
jgi:hypothetical protein